MFLNRSASEQKILKNLKRYSAGAMEAAFLEDVEGDCQGGEQHSGSTLIPSRCGAEKRKCCGDWRFGFVCALQAVSRGSLWERSGSVLWHI